VVQKIRPPNAAFRPHRAKKRRSEHENGHLRLSEDVATIDWYCSEVIIKTPFFAVCGAINTANYQQ
jgi:hypothetical protein